MYWPGQGIPELVQKYKYNLSFLVYFNSNKIKEIHQKKTRERKQYRKEY